MPDGPRSFDADPETDLTRTSGAAGNAAGSIGPYRLLGRLGEGGMGEVWLAEQVRPVRRQVALKVIKAGMDTAQVIARFEAERQALALMDHPAIAKVFDAGSTAEGRPYFAMEYVRGKSLTAYCDSRRLSIRDRLELFVHICEGVQHAHQKGIIHRDLKPSNVLVTVQDDHSVPKIIDFGVAKATSHSLTERTLFTSLSGFVGTLEYMSPEQTGMGGVDIDTRTDVYALGVVLYELLTGVLPFDRQVFQTQAIEEIHRTIREVDPPRPSTRLTQQRGAASQAAASRSAEPSTLAGTLKGDLDWITMKALEKDRTRRYGSVSELAADIRRHMKSEPVLARPATAAYRAGRFVRRHRFGVAAAAAILLLLLSSTIVMAVQARRIARERDRANHEAETAKQIASFLVGLFDVARPSEATANSITARQILDKGADRIRRDMQARSASRGTLLATMGDVYNSVGLYENAQALLEESIEDRSAVFGGRSAEAADGLFRLAGVLWRRGKLADAERDARSALDIRRELLGTEHPDVASSLAQVGWLVAAKGDYKGGEGMLREALRMQRRLSSPPDIRMATTLKGLAAVLFEKGDFEEAEQISREAMKLYSTLLGSGHPDALAQADNVASTMMMRGRYAEAEAVYRANLTDTARTLGEEHPQLSVVWLNIGAAQYFQKKYADAEVSYRQSLAIARKAFAGDHKDIADAIMNLGEAVNAQGRHAAAEALLKEGIGMHRRLLGDDHPQLAIGLTFLAKTQLASGKVAEGEATARQAVRIATEKFGPNQPRTQEAEGALGAILVARRKWAEAEPLLLRYRAALEAKTGADGDLGQVTQQIVDMYVAWNKPTLASEWQAKLR
jgi:tetratricopeptide (TPR) repeat protein